MSSSLEVPKATVWSSLGHWKGGGIPGVLRSFHPKPFCNSVILRHPFYPDLLPAGNEGSQLVFPSKLLITLKAILSQIC